MDNIEEKFFKMFGIEKRCIRPKDCVRKGICRGAVACDFYTYPEITSNRLLQMICIVTRYMNEICQFDSVGELKKATLEELIMLVENDNFHEKCYEDVQSLFKGGE